MKKELLGGSSTMLILQMLKDKDMYGYQIIKELSEKSGNIFEFKEGTLYPILHGLERKNLVNSYWDDSGTKKRKYYAITNKGKKQLIECQKEWKTFSMAINSIMGGALFEN